MALELQWTCCKYKVVVKAQLGNKATLMIDPGADSLTDDTAILTALPPAAHMHRFLANTLPVR